MIHSNETSENKLSSWDIRLEEEGGSRGGDRFGVWCPGRLFFGVQASSGKLLQASGVCAHHGVWRLETLFLGVWASSGKLLQASGVCAHHGIWRLRLRHAPNFWRPGVSCSWFSASRRLGVPLFPPHILWIGNFSELFADITNENPCNVLSDADAKY